jgi:hypothetical protein
MTATLTLLTALLIENLTDDPGHRSDLERLDAALREWGRHTDDSAVRPPATAKFSATRDE